MDARGAALSRPEVDRLLLDGKFRVPQPRPGAVEHSALVKAAQSSNCRLVAVTAPAGYGKSTLLAQWTWSERRPAAWVSLDRFDDDPAMLIVSLAFAYSRAGLGGADPVGGIGGPGLSVLGRAAARLAAEFRASAVPFVLMLDDLHELKSPACHDVLGVVISGIPPGSQLVAASRREQPHVARSRVRGDVLEYGADDLAFDADGARRIFASAQVDLTSEQATAVTDRTEGWQAGLYLAALIAKESHDPARTITGDDRYVTDYLYREALIEQPAEMRRFLRRTAVLDQLCGPLCDAVLGGPPGAAGRLRGWYRYHGLFREFLLDG